MIASFDDSDGYFLPEILEKTNYSRFVAYSSYALRHVRLTHIFELYFNSLYANLTDYSIFQIITSTCNVYDIYVNKYSYSCAINDVARYCQCQHDKLENHHKNKELLSEDGFFYCSVNTKSNRPANYSEGNCKSAIYTISKDHKNLVNV